MLYNVNTDKIVVEHLAVARSFFHRLMGLMGKKSLGKSEGLMLIPCNSIHTCFMKFPIDVVFLNIDHKVIFMKKSVKSWRFINVVRKSYAVIEMPEGTIENKKISAGDLLILK